MFKLISITVVGVFIGAAAVEIISRKKPEVLKKLELKAKHFADRLCSFKWSKKDA